MKRRLAECLILLVAVAVLCWLNQLSHPGYNRLDLEGTRGEYITQGKDWHFTPPTARFQCRFAYPRPDQGIYVQVNGANNDSFSLCFAAPNSRLLSVGHYAKATRFPFQQPADPGLSVSGCGRGCNTLNGSFDVLEVEYDKNGPVRFAADFTQISEGNPPRAFHGSIRFNSSMP